MGVSTVPDIGSGLLVRTCRRGKVKLSITTPQSACQKGPHSRWRAKRRKGEAGNDVSVYIHVLRIGPQAVTVGNVDDANYRERPLFFCKSRSHLLEISRVASSKPAHAKPHLS